MTIDELVEQIGESVNGQITYSWDTRQTLEQYAEVREQSGQSAEFDLEDFAEYVRDNVFEILAEDAGRKSMRKAIYVTNQYGTPIDE